MSVRATKSGLSRDLQRKIEAKYDSELASECLQWALDLITETQGDGEQSPDFDVSGDPKSFAHVLHDGIVLARLANALMPGSIDAKKLSRPPKLAFKQMELIELFIHVARDFGVPDHEAFQTVDLYEEQNLNQVVNCLQTLGRKAKAKGLIGFGPKEANANRRTFTEEQLKAGGSVIGLQMGTNKGASQAGMTFGKQRMIID